MGRAAFTKNKILMLREAKRIERPLSKVAGGNRDVNNKCKGNEDIKGSSSWVPHPKSGIYFPKGHEWVMDDVPGQADSFARSFWVRSVDGVEKPEPTDELPVHGDHHYFQANM